MVKFLKALEMSPLLGFAIAFYTTKNIQTATLTVTVLMTLFIFASKACGEKLTKFQLLTWFITVFLGGISLLTKDSTFFKWKITVINGLLAFVFLFSHFIGEETVLERIGSKHLANAQKKLRTLNLVTVFYFAFVAVVNLLVLKYYQGDDETWALFKIFGMIALNLVFAVFCYSYLKEELTVYLNKQQNQAEDK